MTVKYELTEGNRHLWSYADERGGVHIWAQYRDDEISRKYNWLWTGGVERHSPVRGEYDSAEPSHDECWLIGKPCWHDGSSLYFSENIAPELGRDGTVSEWAHKRIEAAVMSWHFGHFGGPAERDPEFL